VILVVDDMPLFRDPIAACLKLAGFTTQCASDGAEALGIVRADPPELILLDISMPRMDGLTFLKILRGDSRLQQIPVILLTASSDRKSVVQAAKLGISDYLLKSQASSVALIERIQQRLSKKPSAEKPAASAGAPAAAAPLAAADAEKNKTAVPQTPASSAPTAHAPAPAAQESAPHKSPAAIAAPAQAAASDIPRLLTAEDCQRRIHDATAGKALAGIVAQVISAANSPQSDLTVLSTMVSRDPSLSARVLALAGSAAYATGHKPIASVTDAVRRIGSIGIRNVAAATGIFDTLPPSGADGFNPLRCWQHCFAVAQLCEHLAGAGGGTTDQAVAYTVGVCHDLGDIIFHNEFAKEYQQVLEMQKKTGLPRDELERKMLGMPRRVMTLKILKSLNLPEPISGPIEAFLEGMSVQHGAPALAGILRMAEYYANSLMLFSSDDAPIGPISRAECKAALGHEHPPRPDGDKIRMEVFALTCAMAKLKPAEEKRLTELPHPRRDLNIWLARDPQLSSTDPVQTCLDSLANVDMHEFLPRAGQITNHRAIVILSRSTTSPFAVENIAGTFPYWQGHRPPMLWLVGAQDKPVPPEFPVRKWPISFSQFAELIQSI
jgi:CheY-like chemotaxis protein/HD-like signal output (HDOD) protein